MITVVYDCDDCGLHERHISVRVFDRGDLNLRAWAKSVVLPSVLEDHKSRRPQCSSKMFHAWIYQGTNDGIHIVFHMPKPNLFSRLWSRWGWINKTDHGQNMSKLNDLTGPLKEIQAQEEKARLEIRTKVDSLQADVAKLTEQLSNVEIPAEAQAVIDSLKATTQALDDVVPDAPPVEPTA